MRTGWIMVAALAVAATPALALDGASVERIDSASVRVSWSDPDPVSVYVADDAEAPLAKAELVAADTRAGTVTVPLDSVHRRYVLLRDKGDGRITRVAERLIPLEAGSNFRDLGGYPAARGRHVRWGMIFRSGATPLITPADQARIRELGLVNLIDLRSDEERVLAPSRIDGVPSTMVGYSMASLGFSGGMEAGYRAMPTMLAPQLRQIFAKLLRREQPLAYNCSAGQDRTGFTSAMILAALGTPRETIFADYHLSTRYRHPEFEMPPINLEAHPGDPVAAMFAHYQTDPRARTPQPLMTAEGKPFLSFAFEEIESKWGTVDRYLAEEIGLSARDIQQLRASYTE